MTRSESFSLLRRFVLGVIHVLGVMLCAAACGEPVGHPNFMSPHANPIIVNDGFVFVTNTPADTVDVINASTLALVRRINVGIDPVGLARRPDGLEVWVANHVSDSVSVIDTDPTSPTRFQVVATVQDFAPSTDRFGIARTPRSTNFDEPVGIAFASNAKAYVSLSTNNEIAVIDVGARRVVRRLPITAQDPRAIVVSGNRLFVAAFESNNKTQLSGCTDFLVARDPGCTFDAQANVITNNNVNLTGIQVDVVKEPRIDDRDLFVFDTTTDSLVQTIDTVGTLLYGMTVSSDRGVFVAQTDALNDLNGLAGSAGHGLEELQNRAFLNQITRIDCSAGTCGAPRFIDLEPRPPAQPAPGQAFATPFGIQVSDDDTTLVVTAASSNKLFTVDVASGAVIGQVGVESVPRGIALISDTNGAPRQAWVLNVVSNSVSVVDLSDPASPVVTATVALADPTDPEVKRGRMAFHDADASTTGTFSCESCHPDGHTDQLVWVLDTPPCGGVAGCGQVPPRLTMPIRGLQDTEPFLWDGRVDPFGGNNVTNIFGNVPPNCDVNDLQTCIRLIVDAVAATTLCLQGSCATNDEGKAGAGRLNADDRDAMATFLKSVPYPPAQRRSFDNVLSPRAVSGFELFHIIGAQRGRGPFADDCGNCHRMPFWVSTNTPFTGMDAPTWRGAYDRHAILPNNRSHIVDFPFHRNALAGGLDELQVWSRTWDGLARFFPVWDMVLEGSTGFSGAFARQLTLSQTTASTPLTRDLFDALERSDREGAIVLQGEGVLIEANTTIPVALDFANGMYAIRSGAREPMTRDQLIDLARAGGFLGTFTARAGANVQSPRDPQPALWTLGPIQTQRGAQQFPTVSGANRSMVVSSRHVRPGASLYVDGRRVDGSVACQSGNLPTCAMNGALVVTLDSLPTETGIHFLQVQNPGGLFSNDFIFFRQP